MAKDTDRNVSLSLLDKLTNLEPNLRSDPPMSRDKSVRMLKVSLRRDLEWLFNSRANHETPPSNEMPEVFRSVFNYGLPDFSNYSFSNYNDRHTLQKQLEMAITMFEPRLMGVSVRLLDNSYDPGRAIRFQIDGFLKMDPSPEHVSFDTVLDIPSGEYQVKGDANAG